MRVSNICCGQVGIGSQGRKPIEASVGVLQGLEGPLSSTMSAQSLKFFTNKQ